MLFTSWLRSLRSARPSGRADRKRRRSPPGEAPSRFRPWVERLEDRCVPSTLTVLNSFDIGAIPPDPVVPPGLLTALASPGAAHRSEQAFLTLTANVARFIPTDPIIPPDPVVPPTETGPSPGASF
jgi:hypothetical protein